MAAGSTWFSRLDRATIIAFGCIILLLSLGALYDPNFLSADYLLQQLLTASFLGIIATGMMLVILLGQIDLSIPWTITMGGMMATGAAGFFGDWSERSSPSPSASSPASSSASSTASGSPISGRRR